MVRISDARMSGTSYGTCVLHVAPDAASGGPLALVRDGDLIELDVPNRTSTCSSTRSSPCGGVRGSRLPCDMRGAGRPCSTATCSRHRTVPTSTSSVRSPGDLKFIDPVVGRS